jgi:hypothetical protein
VKVTRTFEVKSPHTKAELIELARELKVRKDWHEPDEQGITVELGGTSFDNACSDEHETHILIKKYGEPIAMVNLATLFAWACGYQDE